MITNQKYTQTPEQVEYIEDYFKWVEDIVPISAIISSDIELDITKSYLINWACIWNDQKLISTMFKNNYIIYEIVAYTDKLVLITEVDQPIEWSSRMVYRHEDISTIKT